MDINTIRRLLDYDPATGILTWRHRPPELFSVPFKAAAWNARYAGKEAFINEHVSGYRKGLLFGKTYRAHRVAWAIFYGDWPAPGLDLDHANGVKTDNRIANLRLATRSQNRRNAGPILGRPYRGVVRSSASSWMARCADAQGRPRMVYGFASAEAAARGYDKMAKEFGGEFAWLHYPEGQL